MGGEERELSSITVSISSNICLFDGGDGQERGVHSQTQAAERPPWAQHYLQTSIHPCTYNCLCVSVCVCVCACVCVCVRVLFGCACVYVCVFVRVVCVCVRAFCFVCKYARVYRLLGRMRRG
jgi:hypothetical protein